MLQSTGIDRYLTVRETIAMYATFYPHPRPVDEVIGLVGLEEKRRARVGTLSGGQQRRLDVAIALVGNPDLLFLDEPTTGFDPSARREAWDVIKNLATLGMTVLLDAAGGHHGGIRPGALQRRHPDRNNTVADARDARRRRSRVLRPRVRDLPRHPERRRLTANRQRDHPAAAIPLRGLHPARQQPARLDGLGRPHLLRPESRQHSQAALGSARQGRSYQLLGEERVSACPRIQLINHRRRNWAVHSLLYMSAVSQQNLTFSAAWECPRRPTSDVNSCDQESAPGGIRTHTVRILRPQTLPVGLPGRITRCWPSREVPSANVPGLGTLCS